jgi:dienelactone hydrolase
MRPSVNTGLISFRTLLFCTIAAIGSAIAQQSPAPPTSVAPSSESQKKTLEPQLPLTPEQTLDAEMPTPKLPPGIDPETGIPYYKEIEEDWGSLQVGKSELYPEKPLVAQTDEGDGFTRTLVALKWRPGDALDVWVILPKGVTKPPAVLYLYNYLDDTDRFRNDGWCQRVTGGGVAAIGFVSALSGHRFHDRPMKQWFVSELQESLGSTVHDVKFILDYLASRGDIDMDRVGMFGQGSGATIAILAASADPRIKAVDALDPWGNWPAWLADSPVSSDDPERAEYVKSEFLKKVALLDPVKWLPQLKTPHIRVQQNLEDGATPRACKDRIRSALPKRAEVNRFDSTAKFMNAEGRGRLFDWIKEAVVKPAPPAGKGGVAVATKATARPQAGMTSAAKANVDPAPSQNR